MYDSIEEPYPDLPPAADADGLVQTSDLRFQEAIDGDCAWRTPTIFSVLIIEHLPTNKYFVSELKPHFPWQKNCLNHSKTHFNYMSRNFKAHSNHMFISTTFFCGKRLAAGMTLRTMATGSPGAPHATCNASRVRPCQRVVAGLVVHPRNRSIKRGL